MIESAHFDEAVRRVQDFLEVQQTDDEPVGILSEEARTLWLLLGVSESAVVWIEDMARHYLSEGGVEAGRAFSTAALIAIYAAAIAGGKA